MKHSTIVVTIVGVVLASGVAADTQVPWVGEVVFAPTQEGSIHMTPDGDGAPLSEARQLDNSVVDATIRVRLVNSWLDPIANFPFEDLWLQFDLDEGTAAGCVSYGGSYEGGVFLADSSTSADGWTEFALPLRGGGWSEGPVWIYLNGGPAMAPDFITWPPLPLRANSPDLNGDLLVNLSDIAPFTMDLFGEYHYRSDLMWDGVINLADVVLFTRSIGVVCE